MSNIYIYIYMYVFHYFIPYIHIDTVYSQMFFSKFAVSNHPKKIPTHPAADLVPWHHPFHHCEECLAGADIVVQVGDEVTKDEPLTTNPNVGGFGQAFSVPSQHFNSGGNLHGWEEKWPFWKRERWCVFLSLSREEEKGDVFLWILAVV